MADVTISKRDLSDLRNEITLSEKMAEDKLLGQMREVVERYTGRHVPSIGLDWDIVLNEIYPIIQHELPAIFFRNPRAYMKPRNKTFIAKRTNKLTGEKEEVLLDSSKSAQTQEALTNYTLYRIRYKEEVRRVLLDSLLFKFGILWHGYKGNFGMTDEQSIYIQNEEIFVRRISPMQFSFDPTVTLARLDEARWIARSFDVSVRDLEEDDRLTVDPKIKGRPGFGMVLSKDAPAPSSNGGWDTRMLSSKTRTLLDYADEEYKKSSRSRFAKVYEILERPSPADRRNGSKGRIILWTPEQEKPLRVSAWPYKGEGWIAKVLMFNEVPDSIYGISDMEVFSTIADHKNLVINLQLRNAQANSKNLIFFNKSGMDEEEIQKIEAGEQNIVGVQSDAKPQAAALGGQASSELYLLDQRIQSNLDEKSGITDLKKGFLRSGEESATSVKIREAGASARPAYRQDVMADFLRDSVGLINDLVKQFLPYDEAVRIIGSLDLEWSENPTKEELQADVDCEIDVISMLPENPEDEAAKLKIILDLMVGAITNPQVMQKIMEEGNTLNISPVIKHLLLRMKLRDPEIFRAVRPEESMGFAPVAELKAAQANTEAALQGGEPPSPPAPGQDHAARLSVYSAAQRIFALEGRVSDILEQLILVQQALAQEEAEKNAPRAGQTVNLKAPKIENLT